MMFQKIATLIYCYIADNKTNNLTIQQYNNNESQEGFTLIELMVVISVTSVLGVLGIAGFSTFNQIQVLQSATNDVVTTLNVAKSRAQSQVKPSSLCATLSGYKVVISHSANDSYALYVSCLNVNDQLIGKIKNLPKDIVFKADTSFFFPVQKGGSETNDSITISDKNGRSKTIDVSLLGGVSIRNE